MRTLPQNPHNASAKINDFFLRGTLINPKLIACTPNKSNLSVLEKIIKGTDVLASCSGESPVEKLKIK